MKEKLKIKDFLKSEGISPRKKLGQNFLINSSLAKKIADTVKQFPPPYTEVGPGTGALTMFFDKKDIFLIERDPKLASYWTKKGFSTYCQDALKCDFGRFPSPFTIFGNLPYSLAGPLLIKSSLYKNIPQMIFMVQKEVALRIKGGPATKNYGLLSVVSHVFWKTSFIGEAKPNDFYPVPKVSGQILKFKRNSKIPPEISENPGLFIKFLKQCFSYRRKKFIKQFPTASIQKIESFLYKSERNLNSRAEELFPEEFVNLYSLLSKND